MDFKNLFIFTIMCCTALSSSSGDMCYTSAGPVMELPGGGGNALNVFHDAIFTCPGAVTLVDVFIVEVNWFSLDAWRQDNGDDYVLVGQYGWDNAVTGRQIKVIPPTARYAVDTGDIMGVHFQGGTPRSLAYQRTSDGPHYVPGLEALGSIPCTAYRYAFIDVLYEVNIGESRNFPPREDCRAAAINVSTQQPDSMDSTSQWFTATIGTPGAYHVTAVPGTKNKEVSWRLMDTIYTLLVEIHATESRVWMTYVDRTSASVVSQDLLGTGVECSDSPMDVQLGFRENILYLGSYTHLFPSGVLVPTNIGEALYVEQTIQIPTAHWPRLYPDADMCMLSSLVSITLDDILTNPAYQYPSWLIDGNRTSCLTLAVPPASRILITVPIIPARKLFDVTVTTLASTCSPLTLKVGVAQNGTLSSCKAYVGRVEETGMLVCSSRCRCSESCDAAQVYINQVNVVVCDILII